MDINQITRQLTKEKQLTAGQITSDILAKGVNFIDPIEFAQNNLEPYLKKLFQYLEAGKKSRPQSDFFIVANGKHERILQVAFSWIMEVRDTCPSPFYDQAVYKYTYSKDELDLIWQIPDLKSCWKIWENRQNMDPSQYELLNFVLEAKDGTLWRKMKELNGEELDSIMLEKK